MMLIAVAICFLSETRDENGNRDQQEHDSGNPGAAASDEHERDQHRQDDGKQGRHAHDIVRDAIRLAIEI
ncbi:MAG TPA: hypothetical protein VK427_13895, partial [Kofleriaceae bacterium]|nr:hypothetical protein [Kofleriaceae bacterium]